MRMFQRRVGLGQARSEFGDFVVADEIRVSLNESRNVHLDDQRHSGDLTGIAMNPKLGRTGSGKNLIRNSAFPLVGDLGYCLEAVSKPDC